MTKITPEIVGAALSNRRFSSVAAGIVLAAWVEYSFPGRWDALCSLIRDYELYIAGALLGASAYGSIKNVKAKPPGAK